MMLNILIVALVALGLNIFLGKYRSRFRKMTIKWWLLIHASIPVIIPLRIYLNIPPITIPLFIGLAIIGQVIGNKILSDSKKDQKNDRGRS